MTSFMPSLRVRALAELELRRRQRQAERTYVPRGNAAVLMHSDAPEIVLSGPAGTGKSRANLQKLHWAAETYSGARSLIIRKTRESLTESALFTFEQYVLGLDHPMVLNGPQRNYRQSYRYPNGSRIVVGGMDKPSKIMSTEFDIVYVQEMTELDDADLQALNTRLRNGKMPYQQLIGDCNPDSPLHWLYVRALAGKTILLPTDHKDNPTLWSEELQDWTEKGRQYLAKLQNLSGAEYERLYLGNWVQATGLVYDVWGDGPEDGNVTEAAEYLPDGGPVFWAVDDGYSGEQDPKTGYFTENSSPRVFLLVQERSNGRLCVFYESYEVKTLEDQQLARVRSLGYPDPVYAAVDSAAAELRGRMHADGIYTQGKPHNIEESIKALRRMLAPDENNWRRILVHPRCKHLRAEMSSYRRDPVTEKPIDSFNHGPDALRYLAWTMRHAA